MWYFCFQQKLSMKGKGELRELVTVWYVIE